MAGKKSVKIISKRKNKKVVAKRTTAKAKKIVRKKSPKKFTVTKNKFKLVVRQLIFFAVLTIISSALYVVSNNLDKAMYVNLFFLLAILFGFITLAFLIVLLILFFVKNMKK